MVNCPECDALIEDKGFDLGEIIECPDCGVELEVVAIDPLEVDLFEEEEK